MEERQLGRRDRGKKFTGRRATRKKLGTADNEFVVVLDLFYNCSLEEGRDRSIATLKTFSWSSFPPSTTFVQGLSWMILDDVTARVEASEIKYLIKWRYYLQHHQKLFVISNGAFKWRHAMWHVLGGKFEERKEEEMTFAHTFSSRIAVGFIARGRRPTDQMWNVAVPVAVWAGRGFLHLDRSVVCHVCAWLGSEVASASSILKGEI